MDSRIQSGSFTTQLSPAILTLVEPVVMVFLLPLFQVLGHATGASEMQRLSVGFFFILLATAVAAAVELTRKNSGLVFPPVQSVCAHYPALDLPINQASMLSQLPQYLLLAAGKALAVPSGFNLLVSRLPSTHHDAATPVLLFAWGLGAVFTANFLVWADRMGWTPNDLNAGSQELLYLAMTAFAVVCFMGFVWFALNFDFDTPIVHWPQWDGEKKQKQTALPGETITCTRPRTWKTQRVRRLEANEEW
jgi:hypothetical protein